MERGFYENNRRRLWEKIGGEDTVFVCWSGRPKRRTADEEYPFYANRSFVYLTGLEQAELTYLAWQKDGQFHETLFLPKVDAMHERWFGRMLHKEQIAPISGIASVQTPEQFESKFRALVSGAAAPVLFLDFDPPLDAQTEQVAFRKILREQYPWIQVQNAHPALQRLRTIKQPEEIAELRRSIALTGEGIRAMLRACKPGLYEYQLRAEFEYTLAQNGYGTPAFDSIVAAGKNTLVMHYPEQDAQLQDGDLVLVDVGAQCGHCGADISRVFPANGKFSERQKQLHHASMTNIDELCRRIKPGMPISEVDRIGDQLLYGKLKALGLLEKPEEVRNYRWHATSHHLGFDTHDDNDYTMPLAPGMVITMEVGIYVPQWGEGVRIEDDILITEQGCENLALGIPRTVEEVEAVMAQR